MSPRRAFEPPAPKLAHQLGRQIHPAPGGFGLDLRESPPGVLLAHIDLACGPVDVAPCEPEQLAFPKAGQHGGEDDHAPAGLGGREKRLDLEGRQDVGFDEIVAPARTAAELGAFRGVRLKIFVPYGVAEHLAQQAHAFVHGCRPDAPLQQVRPEVFHVGPPDVPHLPALKPRHQVQVHVAAVVFDGRSPNIALGVLQVGLRQILEAHSLGGRLVGTPVDLPHPLGQQPLGLLAVALGGLPMPAPLLVAIVQDPAEAFPNPALSHACHYPALLKSWACSASSSPSMIAE